MKRGCSSDAERQLSVAFGDVGTAWLATGEHKDWNLQGRDLVDQMLTLLRAEFYRVTFRLSGSTAMDTCEIAGLRNLPDRG
jgi:hypothetical protein